jgi:hypothetical protein
VTSVGQGLEITFNIALLILHGASTFPHTRPRLSNEDGREMRLPCFYKADIKAGKQGFKLN